MNKITSYERLEAKPGKTYEGIRYNLLEKRYEKERENCGCCSCGCLIIAGLTGVVLYEIYSFLI